MQLRMSPTAGIPSWVRSTPDEPPSSATVTTAVRLEVCSLRPRSSVESPVPPPIATIARAAGEEPLLVDDLDHRLLAVPGLERVDEGADQPIGAVQEQRHPEGAGDQAPELVRQPLEGDDVDDVGERVRTG